MTVYRKFKFEGGAPATVATFATLQGKPAQTVAFVAAVARSSAENSSETVATVAGGARQKAKLEVAPDALLEPDQVEIEEREAMAMGAVPKVYLDAWARLQVQKPMAVSDEVWQRAIDDAGRFRDEWAAIAVEFDWTPRDLFDVPRDGKFGGLVWGLKGEKVRAIGPEHAVMESGRVYDRTTRGEWAIPISRLCTDDYDG